MDTPLKRILCVFSSNGTLGVYLFFILSGFLISFPFFKRLDEERDWYPPGYILRRTTKVIPPLYISIICLTILAMIQSHTWAPIIGAIETMAFFQIFRSPNPMISPIYWSLAAEVAFYTVLPVLFLIFRSWLRKKQWLIPLILIGISTGIWLAVCGNSELYTKDPLIRDVLLSFVYFGWGTLFSCVYVAFPKATTYGGPCAWAGLAGFMGCCIISTHYWLAKDTSLTTGMFTRLVFVNALGASGFLMLFLTYSERAVITRILSLPLLALAGLVSYEWYLFHLIFLFISDHITGSELHGSYRLLIVRIFFMYPVSFIFAAAFYRLFSLPILRWAHQPRVQQSPV
jgi:peptidoglycan/LPS O-acetylase OafA/YrhL